MDATSYKGLTQKERREKQKWKTTIEMDSLKYSEGSASECTGLLHWNFVFM
jgi:hypothetical protein